MKYRIDNLKKGEINKIIEFHNKYLGKRDFINKEEILKRLTTNSGIFLVAKDEDNKIVGIKLGYIDNNICIGRGIAVDKKFRKQGVGRQLVKSFENKLKNNPNMEKYVFASSTQEGVPFHIKLGYKPSILLQSKNKKLLESLTLEKFIIKEYTYNKEYKVHQIQLESNKDLDLNYLSKIKSQYPEIDIQYLFEKNF
jgi:N-acetylglutamate synthase-like GNAT family acetyltransferase